jgi:predicted phosphate transport protein (TIGR00153 family)
MFGWFQALMPREDRFFHLYNRHAETLVEGAKALRTLLNGGPGVTAAAAEIYRFEEQADAITRDILQLVRRSFITPFDRSDIQDLVTALDDSIDQMKKTAKSVLMFEVQTMEPEMTAMGEHILKAANLTVEAVKMLSALRENHARLHIITEEIVHLEEHSDTLNDNGIKALYKKHRDGNAMNYIVGIEIYDHLEKVMDRFEDVANRISSIVIEQV